MATGRQPKVTLAGLMQKGEHALETRVVRGVVDSNVADLAAFTVASRDGLTLVEDDRVLLIGQSTGAQNGVYKVGAVSAGSAALTRVADLATGQSILNGRVVDVSEGTVYGGSTFRAACTGSKVVGTDNPLFTLRSGSSKNSTPVLYVRGVVDANVASLAAFTVAGNDGLTYVEGELVLLALQTTAAQCGVYRVGAVATGTAPLTRVAEMASGAAIRNGQIVEVSEGTLYAGTTWKAMCTGSKVVGTDDPLFYPQVVRISAVALVAGTKTLGATQGVWLFSASKSTVHITVNTPNTVTSTVQYQAAAAGRTAGKVGTGAVIVQANVAAGTINVADISTLDVTIINA